MCLARQVSSRGLARCIMRLSRQALFGGELACKALIVPSAFAGETKNCLPPLCRRCPVRAGVRPKSRLPDGGHRDPEYLRQFLMIHPRKQTVRSFTKIHVCTPVDKSVLSMVVHTHPFGKVTPMNRLPLDRRTHVIRCGTSPASVSRSMRFRASSRRSSGT
jgi:hypothetical protein